MSSVKATDQARRRWINNDPAFLQALSHHIAEDKSIDCLTSADRKILLSPLPDTVHSANAAPPNKEQVPARSADHNRQSATDGEIDPLTSLFRKRFLIYENCIISEIFPTTSDDFQVLVDSFEINRQASTLDRDVAQAAQKTLQRAISEDEDYDEPEDEDVAPQTVNEPDGNTKPVEETTSSALNGHAEAGKKETLLEAAEDRKNEDAILAFEIDTMYHTLEFDRQAMLEQNTLDASDRQIQEESGAAEKEKLSAVNFGAANLSLKHLIAKIDESRDKLGMSDNELRNLLSDVRKNRSKWASEDKVGQEELYEAAEKVVLELRGYTEHSTAFLNKVTKREVPDYYNVIKEPMDLGTLMKNLKNLQYKSKAEFQRDLMLIWQNCLTYNVVVTHPLREHAKAMRTKSEQLLSMVPDVVIRDRAALEAEELELADDDDDDDDEEDEDEDDQPLAGKSTRGTFGPKSTKAKKSQAAKHSATANGNVEASDRGDVERSRSPERIDQAQKSIKDESTESTQMAGAQEHQLANDGEDIAELNIGMQIWRTRTKKTRARYSSARHRRLKEDFLKDDEIALDLSRRSLTELPYGRAVAARPAGENEINESTDRFDASTGNALDGSDDLILREYEACSMPELAKGLDEEVTTRSSFPVDDLSPYEPRNGALWDKMRATTTEMKNIRRLCTKLSTLKLMQDPTMAAFPASYFRQLMEADTPLNFQEVELEQAGLDCEGCGPELARSLIQRASVHVLYQAGFEDFQINALNSFAEIAGDYLKTMGKMLKEYTESQQNLSDEEIIRHTLFEVGVPSLNDLEDYVVDEIDNKSEKITALHDRLRKFLNDFIHGAVDGENGGDLFDESNQDAFVAGSFGDETGEDFFGFRELGLEAEFGMSSLSVPLRLLQGRLRPSIGNSAVIDGEALSALRFDRKFHHITKEVAAKQIGLFRAFLDAKFSLLDDEEDNDYLVEDEDLPVRQRKPKPRLGPTGKIVSAMKRALKDPNLSPKKKKKTEQSTGPASPTAIFT